MQNQQQQEKMDELKTGTTTVGMTTEDGVILAADRRASMGRLTASKYARKIYKLDDNLGLTIAGSVGDAQKIVRTMRSQLNLHKLETKELSIKGAGTLLSNILHGNKMMPFMNQFILGGINEDGGVLYDLDPAGGLMAHHKYTATGSGSQMAYGVLENRYEKGMDHEEAKKLAIESIQSAMERDTASGNGVMVAEITEDGFEVVEEKEVESTLN
ncbi:20S proteasome, beta subunit [Candidatus Nanohalococcus occultus]|uniref:Proteasome subunit beta n=2 Tax=Candidatus Nanohalococcus occultus TaxID=2978047 RepID=A0ABY8CIH2_9ARCH|nr:20S proteasome, beta subunit [Candidatus Nanohaloarchaeota archaeon SVXNc]